ncbi:aminotransferase class IV [Effusibacillus lacus]|uniref:4-amino-4-deoxychorismate lyase n=1 Tax=Effusibacillus lacus TaxID=1348429 RepID=A0A292YHW8_9BACL|nr:aminotransferase class IV [Effusibacillus lacus]TCS74494.1 branched-chain amino acid aminotransferase/4-amino-4-deoxychorismate lyase [Effusibacillus lacus]GAX88636.1 4-amino-4-deoxychorismate lyase [Effusibacillus lacus]
MITGKVWVNGKIVPIEEACISVLDHGFLYGHGVFETMRTYAGRTFLFREHLERMRSSAALIRIVVPFTDRQLEQGISELLMENRLTEAYVRITVSRGAGPMGIRGEFGSPTVLIFAKPLPLLPEEVYLLGRDLCILQTRRNSPETGTRIKSLNYLNSLLGAWEAEERGYAEGIMLDAKGNIAEGTVSNLFFVEEDHLVTPSPDTGLLTGVTRSYVLTIAKSLGIETVEAAFSTERLKRFSEGFTTNSLSGIVPIRSVEGQLFPECPGPVTSLFMERHKLVVKEGAFDHGV